MRTRAPSAGAHVDQGQVRRAQLSARFPVCAMWETALGEGDGVVRTRGHRRLFPVLCDSCAQEDDEIQRQASTIDEDE